MSLSKARSFVNGFQEGYVRLSDLEPRFVCTVCGKRGADVRPDFNWDKPPVAAMGYR
jgi:hypothetical protein